MIRAARQPDQRLGWMGSLAAPTRLRLLRLLEQHELGVAELCDVVQLGQSNVSRHLKVLSEQDWLRSRRQGTVHLYRAAATEANPAAKRLWTLAREQTESWPTVKQDQLRLARHLQERRAASEAFFAGAAGQWDRLRDELLAPFPRTADDTKRQLCDYYGMISSQDAQLGRILAALDESGRPAILFIQRIAQPLVTGQVGEYRLALGREPLGQRLQFRQRLGDSDFRHAGHSTPRFNAAQAPR